MATLSRKLRFEVFKRDAFICQYCGQGTPDVILEADHIHPRSKGGKDDIDNLITACYDCNRGKGAIPLSKKVSRKDLERRIKDAGEASIQLEEYRKHLAKKRRMEDKDLITVSEYWSTLWEGRWGFSKKGESTMRMFLKKHPKEEILESMDIAHNRRSDNINECYRYLCGVLHTKRKRREEN